MEKNKISTLSLALIVVLVVIIVASTISSSGENKRLKRAINDNLLQIEKLESEKITIFESIKKDSLLIIEKDSVIAKLTSKEDSLINTLKTLNYERSKINSIYINADVNKRVDIFAKLATETDSIR